MSATQTPRPTAREHITQIAEAHGWTVTPELFTGVNTVGDLIDRRGDVVLITWVNEGHAATDIKVAQGDSPLAPIKAPRAMGLIALRAMLEGKVAA